MKALIIGAAGFVGKYLLLHLQKEIGWETVVTKLPHERIDNQDVQVIDLNILDTEATRQVISDVAPDYIFHLAAQSSVALSWKNPELTLDINVKGALHVLEAVRNLKHPTRLLLIGSGEEYGAVLEKELPITEENVLRPGNVYAVTKAAQNMLGMIYAKAYKLDVICVRAFNHIGPGQAPFFVVADFCRQIARIEAGLQSAVMLVGNLSARRDFSDVRDVVRAYGLLMQRGCSGELYNVGSGKGYAIQTILDLLLSMAKVHIEIRVDSEKFRPVDVPLIVADTTKIYKDTQWICTKLFEETLKDTLEYWRNFKEEGH